MHKKGNISILVIFVLLASSLLGVLAMNFVQSMMKQSATIYNYYQSYYLAKAGVEIGLTELLHRGVGFEQTFDDTGFVQSNFLCGTRCHLVLDLSGTASNLSPQFWTQTGCQTPFVLSGGGALIVPVFQDTGATNLSYAFGDTIAYQNLFQALRAASIQTTGDALTQVTFGMVILSGDELAEDGIYFQQGALGSYLDPFLTAFDDHFRGIANFSNLDQDIDPYRFFFLISNTSSGDISFCMQTPYLLPTQQYYLRSQGVYDHQRLGLEAIYKQPIPDFLLNGYVSF